MATAEGFVTSIDSTDSPYDYTDDYTFEYNSDYNDEVCSKASTMLGQILTPVFFSIVVIFSLFGNVLVIVILVKFENLKSITNAFILNLALSDLFFTAGLPFWAYYHMYGWTFGENACKIVSFVFYTGFYSSAFLLILMTAHRYVAVMNPLSDIVTSQGLTSVLASIGIWVTSALLATPTFFFMTVVDQIHCVYTSSYWTVWGIYQQNVLFILSSVAFIFCYSQIMCRLLRPTAQRRKSKTIKLILILIVHFFASWAPYNIIIFLKSFYHWPAQSTDSKSAVTICEKEKELDYAFYISRLLAFSHCCLNPMFYVFVGVKFKNHLKKILKGWGHSRSSIRNRHSRLTITSVTSGEEFSM